MRLLSRCTVRFCRMLFFLACAWTLCGAPILADQWRHVPAHLQREAMLLPGRMASIFRHWVSSTLSTAHAAAATRQVDLSLRIWDADQGTTLILPLERYVFLATAAEMPAVYHPAALQAQAIAVRTRAVYDHRALGGNGCAAHPDHDLCTDAACCQAYLSEAALRERWGDDFPLYEARIRDAVAATAGQILTYDGLPIEVLYHACSGGRTEDAAAVFAEARPYLISVDSPGEESASVFAAETTYTLAETVSRLNDAFPDAHLTAEGFAGQVRLQSSTASGRIATVLVGQTVVSGTAFRKALDLRSTLVSWDVMGDTVTFRTRGYGHGVGMSQAGANAMASTGSDCRAILMHYYPGTQVTLLPVMHDDPPIGAD